MKPLAYCVLRDGQAGRCAPPAGVEAAPVCFAAAGGLAAAYSVVPDACAVPTLSRATAYAWVVEALHQAAAVVPFRYGNFLKDREQVLAFLGARRAEFIQFLEETEGCDEMGLRLLQDRRGPACASPCGAASDGGTGRDYLAARRAHYAAEEYDEGVAAQAAAEVRGALEGLAVKCRAERSSGADGQLLSLYFLVRRENVEHFREAFRQLQQETSAKMLLTGPWPPYNFVGGPCLDGRAERS